MVFYRSLTLEGCGACLYKIHDNLYLSTSIRKQLNWYMIWDSCLAQPNKGLSEHKFICDNNAWIYMLCIRIQIISMNSNIPIIHSTKKHVPIDAMYMRNEFILYRVISLSFWAKNIM